MERVLLQCCLHDAHALGVQRRNGAWPEGTVTLGELACDVCRTRSVCVAIKLLFVMRAVTLPINYPINRQQNYTISI